MSSRQDERTEVDISDRLRAIQNHHRLTVAELASRIGVSKSAMEKYLAGPSSPRAGTIVAICEQFGVTADWLLFSGISEEPYAFRRIVSDVIESLVNDLRSNPASAKLWLGDVNGEPVSNAELWTRSDKLALEAYVRFAEWRREHRSDIMVLGAAVQLSV
jgi:transcriptional regulator with XRE-family HTH domain